MATGAQPETVGASDFKARCLKILDEVAETGRPVTVTKHGKPIARLVPIAAERKPFKGRWAGKARTLGDIVSSDAGGWDPDETVREWDEIMAQGDV
ncbi:MAG: type II toxin-antitoxin system prevent-host-death family antitoxin [Acidobacteria bacterium]|nr:type II toxin-antitoxin system prevent-host-death family antitoxin [Acidobacteriota bacterium]